jgi:beta-glucanase (GH16 family)
MLERRACRLLVAQTALTGPERRTTKTPKSRVFDHPVSHDFKIVWKADEIPWYIDGQLMVTHTRDLPTVSAPLLFNMWGTDKVT